MSSSVADSAEISNQQKLLSYYDQMAAKVTVLNQNHEVLPPKSQHQFTRRDKGKNAQDQHVPLAERILGGQTIEPFSLP